MRTLVLLCNLTCDSADDHTNNDYQNDGNDVKPLKRQTVNLIKTLSVNK
jgi:hypothetical protein